MRYEPTDKTITIQCGDCDKDHFEIGLEDMKAHIKKVHPNYNEHEINVYAMAWMEDAYDRYDLEMDEYHKNQKTVNAIRRQSGEF